MVSSIGRRLGLSINNRIIALGLLEAGMHAADVVDRFGRNERTIHQLHKHVVDRLVVQRIDLLQEDHKKKTQREDIYLMTSSRRNSIMAAPNIVEHLRHATGTRISVYTARNRLRAARLRSRHPFRGFQLTGRHCTARMKLARQHSRWTRQQVNRVVFTDESKFNLHGPDCRVRVW